MGLTIRGAKDQRDEGTAGPRTEVVGVALTPAAEAGYTRHRGLEAPAPPCYAAEVTLNFFVNGQVASCCLGRAEPIGHFPEQTIEEIWSSAAVHAVQESLRAGLLPPACVICRDQIEAGNYSGVMAGVYEHYAADAAAAADRPVLRSVEFEISNACNLECVMCNGWNSSLVRRNREKLPPLPERYGPEFLEQLKPFIPGLKTAKFLGGEPFLVPQYLDIWDALAELNPDVAVSITTNGTVMNRRVRAVVEKLAPNIIISVDSVDAEVYESVRLNARLADVLENVEYFRGAAAQNGADVIISVCPMVQTWRTLPQVVDYCNERSLPVFFNTVVSPKSSSLRSLGRAGLLEVAAYLEGEVERRRAEAGTDPLLAQNLDRLWGVARQVASWEAEMKADDASALDPALAAELEAWSGRPAIHVALDEHEVLSVYAPDWADGFATASWVGANELDLMPKMLEAVGAFDVDVELTEREGGVLQADLVFTGGEGHLRVLRLPVRVHNQTRHDVLIGFVEPPVPVVRDAAGESVAPESWPGDARSVDPGLADELEAWSGRAAMHVALRSGEVLAVHAPDWASPFAPDAWVGSNEIDLMPELMAAVGTDDVEVEVTERPDEVVQADLAFAGGTLGRLRVLRLPFEVYDRTRHSILIAFQEAGPPPETSS